MDKPQTSFPKKTLRTSKNFSPYQTLYQKNLFMSNQVYNDFMGRNYFSKYGGPCFRNDGFSKHDHDHKPGETHEDIKPEYKGLGSIPLIGKVTSLLKFPRFKQDK
jgi:hypothetical protein